jgi:hypothetical protein
MSKLLHCDADQSEGGMAPGTSVAQCTLASALIASIRLAPESLRIDVAVAVVDRRPDWTGTSNNEAT